MSGTRKPLHLEVKLRGNAPEMSIIIPHYTGKLSTHNYGKYEGSQLDQDVSL